MTAMKKYMQWDIPDLAYKELLEKCFFMSDRLNMAPYNCANTEAGDYVFPDKFIHSKKMTEPVPDMVKTAEKFKTKKDLSKKKSIPVQKIYRIYAEIEDCKPKIWRRFLIPADFYMIDLAHVIMSLFNMDGSHLYMFKIPAKENKKDLLKKQGLKADAIKTAIADVHDIHVTMDTEEDDLNSYNEDDMVFDFVRESFRNLPKTYNMYDVEIKKLITEENPKFSFIYDFGDDWHIKIKVEDFDVQADSADFSDFKVPRVLSSAGLGIIENCGGLWGLMEMREAFSKKSGEDYENYCKWLGTDEIDFDSFDVAVTNKKLKTLAD